MSCSDRVLFFWAEVSSPFGTLWSEKTAHCLELGRLGYPGILTYFVTEKCSNACNFCSGHSQRVIRIPTCSAGTLLSFGVKIIFLWFFFRVQRGPIRRTVPSQNGAIIGNRRSEKSWNRILEDEIHSDSSVDHLACIANRIHTKILPLWWFLMAFDVRILVQIERCEWSTFTILHNYWGKIGTVPLWTQFSRFKHKFFENLFVWDESSIAKP